MSGRFFVRKLLVLNILLFLFVVRLFSETYYVSNGGQDSNNGLSPSTPFKTIARINLLDLKPGDIILFNRGSLFHGTLYLSGIGDNTSGVIIDSYGEGDLPVISGFIEIRNSWEYVGSSIWKTNIAAAPNLNLLTIDDSVYHVGRYPNSDILKYESVNGKTSITDDELPVDNSWQDAELVIKENNWTYSRNEISKIENNTIYYVPSINDGVSPRVGTDYGYFFQRSIKTLDKFGEWYYNQETNYLYIFSDINPDLFNIKVSDVNSFLVIKNSPNITVRNISFQGANEKAIEFMNCENLKIEKCSVSYSGTDAISGVGDCPNFNFSENVIYWTNGQALSFGKWGVFNNSVISNNTIKNTGIYQGMGSKTGGYSAIFFYGYRGQIINNYIKNVGYLGIYFAGEGNSIRNNFISDFCWILDDGGGIYTFQDFGDISLVEEASKITDNIIVNGNKEGTTPNGIYSDGMANNLQITGNTIAHMNTMGIHLNQARNCLISNNTLFDIKTNHFSIVNTIPEVNVSDVDIFSNLVVTTDESQKPVRLLDGYTDNILNFGVIDSNTYVIPFSSPDYFKTYIYNNGVGQGGYYYFDDWKSQGYDSNSHLADIEFSDYTVNSIIGNNKIGNGTLDANIDGFSVNTSVNSFEEWQYNNSLDGGVLKTYFTGSYISGDSHMNVRIGAIDKNKKYVFRVSTIGSVDERLIQVNLRERYGTFKRISKIRNIRVNKTRSEHEIVFSPTDSFDDCILYFTWNQNDQTIYWDNFELYEVEVTENSIEKNILLEYNNSNNIKNIYVPYPVEDCFGNTYSTQIVLQPYSSIVLIDRKGELNLNPNYVTIDQQTFTVGDIQPGDFIGQIDVSTESDGAAITYTIEDGNSDWQLYLNPVTGRLYTNNNNYDPTKDLSREILVKVNLNENPDIFDTAYVAIIQNKDGIDNVPPVIFTDKISIENSVAPGEYLGQIEASAIESDQSLTYRIISGNEDWQLYLSPSSGKLYTNNNNYNSNSNLSRTILIQVTDNGTPALSATGYVIISQITNKAPIISEQEFVIDQLEQGDLIGTILASDPDEGQSLTYSIETGNETGKFWLSSSSGRLYTTSKYDPVQDNLSGTLVIKVTDNGIPVLSTTGHIIISQITNGTPIISEQEFVIDQLGQGDLIGAILASDPDEGQSLTYSIEAGNETGKFWLSSSSGRLYTTSKYDPVQDNLSGTLVIKVTDNGTPVLSTTGHIIISQITNEAPIISEQEFVIDQLGQGDLIGAILASDPDEGQSLTYSIETGNETGKFWLSSSSGRLYTTSKYDPVQDNLSGILVIKVTDNGTPVKFSLATITIIQGISNKSSKLNNEIDGGQQTFENDITNNYNILIYPNPFKEYININLDIRSDKVSVDLTDINGNIMFTEIYHNVNSQLHISYNLGSLLEGIYILRIVTDDNIYKRSILKN
ncbi:right-handed parallel beta-helix repeat-containing protein [Saccharicrinis sp. FJH2]|uniref:right-handed parallel beta-helix repeat-containing protein n=1 Tax=Saccharicrinis sp. FJH65 TaxID=3344659 RepID=UPI0035F4B511